MKAINLLYFFLLVSFVFSCEKNAENTNSLSNAPGSTGKGGSLARFAIAGNYIYAVSSHFLYTVDISARFSRHLRVWRDLKYQPYISNDC